jgi:hypothetical protein
MSSGENLESFEKVTKPQGASMIMAHTMEIFDKCKRWHV